MKKNQSASKFLIVIFLFTVIATVVSCTKDHSFSEEKLNLPSTPYDYNTAGFSGSFNMNIKDMIRDESKKYFNDHTATLGRVLFYDKKMSVNNSVSCGSCHKQSLAFADGAKFSTGFANKKTSRNSMAILNPVENIKMFWDSRAANPYQLSLMPVFNHLEMGMESDEMLEEKISGAAYYPELFEKAFGTNEITKERISIAITTFLNGMYSKNSKYDQAMATSFNGYSALEKIGMDLFFSPKTLCSSCHRGANFNLPQYYSQSETPLGTANIGLDTRYSDQGAKNGHFKIPSLRNVALTAPYMHDGRYQTLEEVIEHYNSGVKNNPNLSPTLRVNGQPARLNLSENDKMALVAFLKTLTDESLTSDPKFSNPFN